MATGVDDFEKFAATLAKVNQVAAPLAKIAVGEALAAIEEYSAEYAPASEANQPGRTMTSKTGRVIYLPYYQRGRGTMHPITSKAAYTAMKTSGRHKVKKAKQMPGLAGYWLDPTSERMETRFRIRVKAQRNGEIHGLLENTASYSGWVIGPLSPEADPHQTALHNARGWTAADEAVDQAWPDIEKIFSEMADKIIAELANPKPAQTWDWGHA